MFYTPPYNNLVFYKLFIFICTYFEISFVNQYIQIKRVIFQDIYTNTFILPSTQHTTKRKLTNIAHVTKWGWARRMAFKYIEMSFKCRENVISCKGHSL